MELSDKEDFLIKEIELLLAEKRTHLAILRTGAALFGLSVSALGVLLVLADLSQVLRLAWPLAVMAALVFIAVIGGWQMLRSRRKVKRLNELIEEIEKQDKRIAEIMI